MGEVGANVACVEEEATEQSKNFEQELEKEKKLKLCKNCLKLNMNKKKIPFLQNLFYCFLKNWNPSEKFSFLEKMELGQVMVKTMPFSKFSLVLTMTQNMFDI